MAVPSLPVGLVTQCGDTTARSQQFGAREHWLHRFHGWKGFQLISAKSLGPSQKKIVMGLGWLGRISSWGEFLSVEKKVDSYQCVPTSWPGVFSASWWMVGCLREPFSFGKGTVFECERTHRNCPWWSISRLSSQPTNKFYRNFCTCNIQKY